MSPAPQTSATVSNASGGLPAKPSLPQQGPFCACGRETASIAGLCLRCYRARRHSKDRFGGHREAVLERDGFCCRSCGHAGLLHVHHREPATNEPDRLITVCAACHARLHCLGTIRRWIPEPLALLWAEQHPAVAVQLQFAFGAEP